MSSRAKIVDSTRWFMKKKRTQNERRGRFLAMIIVQTMAPTMRRMDKSVVIGSKREVEISMEWAMLSLWGIG
jgi:hypothetical protein